jgi:filamentous hemagglutinin family protein
MKAHQYLATSIATLLATMGGQRANALPQGEAVAHGKANFKRDGGRMEIRASDRAVINFRGFNIDRNEAVTFVQPGSKSRVLNRVTDGNPTQIFGQLKANGQVMLVNPSGVFFQNGSMVNVGGIIAAAGNISDADFQAGRNRFTELSGEVNNAGTIRATGDVSLVGAHVGNSGIIESGRGMVSLVAGDEVLVGERGGNVYVSGAATPGKASRAGVSNTGKIVAKKALLGTGDFYSVAVQHSGEIRAEKVAVRGGKGGRVEVSGKIDASARGKGKKGGRIEVAGETVALTGATLDASGARGGGEVLVGGDWQGGGTVSRAQTTTVDAATVIHADALRNGPGGKVVVWADGATQFDGRISARGIGAGQAGGQVETSGKLTLGVGQTARVDASSPLGKMGDWLLDPENLTIAAGGGGTIGGAGNQTVDAGVINTAAATVILTATENITFAQAIAMTKAGAGLTATAGGNLVVNGGVTIATNNGEINFTADSDTNGTGFLTLSANSKLTTKGAAVNLLVDHGSAASLDGIGIFGDIDTRPSATETGPVSRFQLKGSAQTGVLEVGSVTLHGGQKRTGTSFARGIFDLYADEIALTGGADSVKGSGNLNLRPSSLTVGMKLAAADNTSNQLDLTATELAAISQDFVGTKFGRTDSNYTGTLVIGDAGGAPLVLDRGGGDTTTIGFESGPNGVLANVKIQANNTNYVEVYGDVIDLKGGLSAPLALVRFQAAGVDMDVEVVAKPWLTPPAKAKTLRLDVAMLKGVADTSSGLQVGTDGTSRSSNLILTDPLVISANSVALDQARVMLRCGGELVFNAPIDAGNKTLELNAGAIQFNNNTSSLIKGGRSLTILQSTSAEGTASTRNIEVYENTPALTTNVLTIKSSDLLALAGNFPLSLTLGSSSSPIGGDVVINAPLDFRGKKINGVVINASTDLLINAPITLGLGGNTGTTKQKLTLRGRDLEVGALISGTGDLEIAPADNGYQSSDKVTYPGGNPLTRGMLIGTETGDADNPNHLTITREEYAKIVPGFNRIIFGQDGMLGDLEIRGAALALKADTELRASSAAKIYTKLDGSKSGGGKHWLWARALEVDIDNKLDASAKTLTNLSGFYVNTLPSGQVPQLRKIVVNGSADQGGLRLDLTKADLGRIDGASVDSLVIGYDEQAHNYVTTATSNLPIEVVGDSGSPWTLTANTELRSVNRIYSEAEAGSPAVYGSISVNAPVNGAGYDLTLRSDSGFVLAGGAGTITNVRALSIAQHKLDVPIRLLEDDSYVNRDALVLSKSSYAALGAGIGSLSVGRSDSKSDLIVSGALTLVTDTTLTTGTYVPGTEKPAQVAGTGQHLSILGAVDGNKTLTLNSFGTTQLAGSIGSATPLASLLITKSADIAGVVQKTVIGSPGGSAVTVRTTGNQTYDETVELLSGGTLEAGGTLTVSQTLAAGANDLALLANEMLLNGGAGGITGTRGLQLGTGTPGTNMTFFGTTSLAGQLDLTQTKLQAIALAGFNKLTLGRADGTGTLSVKENFGLLQETVIQSGGGALNIEKQLNGAQKLTLSSGSGPITASAALGATSALGDLAVLSTGTATFQGAVNAASVFTDVGGSTVLNAGTVTTSGLQDYNDAVVLGAATTLTSSGAGDINLNAGATGAFALNINTSGVTRLKSTITVASVETNVGGAVELAANITTTGTQQYHEQAVLSGDTQLTGTTVTFDEALAGGGFGLLVTGDAQFAKALTSLRTLEVTGSSLLNGGLVSTSGAQTYGGNVTLGKNTTLTSTAAGNIALNGGASGGFALNINTSGTTRLGGTINVGSITTDAGGTVELPGLVTTSGSQTYNDAAVLVAATTLTSTGGGVVGLNGGASGAYDLTINTAGVTTLGGGINVATITTDAAGSVSLSGNITTTGAQTYHDAATLTGATTLTSSSSGNVSLQRGVTGPFDLAVNTSGVTQLGGGISVASITTDAGGSVELGGRITTSGAQTYNENAVLTGGTTLTSTAGGTVGLQSGVSGPFDLVVNTSGATELGGTVSLGSITTDAGGTVKLAGTVTTTGAQTYNDAAVLGAATTLTSSGGAAVAFNGGASGAYDLTINTAGVTTLGGGINVASITTDAAGSVSLSGNITTTGAQTYNDAATLTGATTLSSTGGGALALKSGATGAFDLALNTSGATQLAGTVNLGSITTDAGGTVELPGTVTTSGAQSYNDAVVLGAATTLVSTGGGAVSIKGGATGAFDLAVNTAGVTTLGGGINVATVTTDAAGSVSVSGNITTTGAQTYNDAATLTGATTLSSTGGGAVALKGGATGAFDLTVNTAGVTTLGGGINVASITTDAAGSVSLSGNITTTGAQTYNDAATLTGATTLSSTGGGAVALKSGATGAFDLALNTSGATQLAGGINVGSLGTDVVGATEITGDVTTTGGQTYGDAVQVSGPVALSSTGGGALTLGAGVDGAGSVSLVTSGNVTVTGDSGTSGALQDFSATGARVEVGGVQALGDVTLDATGLLVLQGSSYKAGDTLSLNPTERVTASGRSSIVKPSGDLALDSDKFVMGGGQKLVVSNGALSVTAKSGVAGDLAASVSMDLNVDQLQVLARESGDFTNAGLKDLGLSMVSPKITFNGTLSFSPESTGARKVFWNTATGAVSGKNNGMGLPGSGVGKNAKMSEQFNSVDADGYVLQPLALKPAVVIPPVIVEPPVLPPPVVPEASVPVVKAFVRPVQFDLMNWSLGYRDETLESPDGIWVIRSLGINGRWDNLADVIATRPGARRFLEL